MSWCDKLGSTPTVGFKLSAHFVSFDALLNAVSPILDRIGETGAKDVTVDQLQTFFAVAFTTNDGFKYSLDQSRVSVGFNHRVKFKNVSGGLPTMEMLSRPMPFTKLLPVVMDKLVEATVLLPGAKERTVAQVGIVSTTPIAEEDIPPGIRKLISYMAGPWKGRIDNFSLVINAQMSEAEETTERCIHTITKPEEKDQLITLQFDWQRSFKTGWQITKDNLERLLEEAKRDALTYFEELAEGNRFDEVLIREAVGV